MSDIEKLTDRIVTLLREDPGAIPFVIGWLSYGKELDQLSGAIDAYLKHQEQFAQLLAARRLADEAAKEERTE